MSSIAVVCPHCESRYQLQPELLGKTMRCPHPDCREPFTVTEAVAPVVEAPPPPVEPVPEAPRSPAPPRVDLPPVASTSGNVQDMIPVVELPTEIPYERIEQEEEYVLPEEDEYVVPTIVEDDAPAFEAREPVAKAIPLPKEPTPVAARLDGPASLAPPKGPKEVHWSEISGEAPEEAAPATRARKHDRDQEDIEEVEEEENEAIRRRRRRRMVSPGILVGLVATILIVVLAIVGRIIWFDIHREVQWAEEASEAFKTSNYPVAVEKYESLIREYPKSDDFAKYEFFHELSTLLTQVSSVTFRENPDPAREKYLQFLETHGDTPLAQPDESGFGLDVFDAGRKVADGMIEFSRERLKRFKADRTKMDELGAAERMVTQAQELMPRVERYRVADIEPLDRQREELNELSASFAFERNRLEVLEPWRKLADDPSDNRIAEFVRILAQHTLSDDREAVQIVEEAKLNLRKLIRTVVDNVPPVPAPADVAPALLFVAPPMGEKPSTLPPPPDQVPETVFAVARGLLYALDADSGAPLWSTRVGRGRGYEDVPLRIPLGDGGTELVLIPSDQEGKAALTARVARTGEPFWHQPLDAPIAGRPVIVGKRIYVPLLDDLGTVVEIEATTGTRLAHVVLRQRLGVGLLHQPGTGIVYVFAEGRRVFVLNVEPFDADGNREPMECVQVLYTDHRDQSLRALPALTGPSGNEPAPRFLILAEADGTEATRIRAITIPPVSTRKADEPPPEMTPAVAGTARLTGHVWFSPHSDGERVSVTTDSGMFALYGTNQIGNQDPGLYPIPVAPLPSDPKDPSPSLIAYAEEDEYWVISRGKMLRLRLGLTPALGMQVAPAGLPIASGIPQQPAQVNSRRDTVVTVIRAEESDGVRAIAFDPIDGRIRWQRKLGAVTPAAPVPQEDGSALLIDEDGGTYLLPPEASSVTLAGTQAILANWVIAQPSLITQGTPRVATNTRGTWVLIPEKAEQGRQLRARRIVAGKLAFETAPALPDAIAGPPIALADAVIVPLADGFVYRLDPGSNKLLLGPQWRGLGVPADATCFLTAIDDKEFLGTDGGKTMTRWQWMTGKQAEWKVVAGPWQTRERITLPPVLLPRGQTREQLLAADVTGSIWLFDASTSGEPIRRWRGTSDGPIPSGRPSAGFTRITHNGQTLVAYIVADRHIVCLSPDNPQPVWVVSQTDLQPDWLGCTFQDDRLLATDLMGRIVAIQPADGNTLGTRELPITELFPQSHAVAFGPNYLLMPLWDGSAVFLNAIAR